MYILFYIRVTQVTLSMHKVRGETWSILVECPVDTSLAWNDISFPDSIDLKG